MMGWTNFGHNFRHVLRRRGSERDVGAMRESYTAVVNNVYHFKSVPGSESALITSSGGSGGCRPTMVTASARVYGGK